MRRILAHVEVRLRLIIRVYSQARTKMGRRVLGSTSSDWLSRNPVLHL